MCPAVKHKSISTTGLGDSQAYSGPPVFCLNLGQFPLKTSGVLCRCLSVSQMYSVKMSILQSIAPLHVDHFSSGLFLAWWLQYGAGLQLAESRMVKLVLVKETSHKGIEKLVVVVF